MSDFDKFKFEAIKIIENEFNERKKRNKGYSLRAFARDLNVSPATMTRTLNGTSLSAESYFKILNLIGIKALTKEFMESLYLKSTGKYNEFDEKQYMYWSKLGPPQSLGAKEFALISNIRSISLYCYFFYNNKIDYREIQESLGIPEDLAKESIENLNKVGLLTFKNADEIEAPAQINLVMEDSIGTENIKFGGEVLDKAKERLFDAQLQESEDYAMSNVFTIRADKIEEARHYLNNMHYEFQEKFCIQPEGVEKDRDYAVALLNLSMNVLTKLKKP